MLRPTETVQFQLRLLPVAYQDAVRLAAFRERISMNSWILKAIEERIERIIIYDLKETPIPTATDFDQAPRGCSTQAGPTEINVMARRVAY